MTVVHERLSTRLEHAPMGAARRFFAMSITMKADALAVGEPEVLVAAAARELRSVELSPDHYGGEQVLVCPRCGGGYLHHRGVISYDRNEDDKQTIETLVENGTTSVSVVPSTASRNPSSRRDGIAIQFECEGCGDSFELTIAQHKGVTLVAWRAQP
jgi:hypothetical protein